MSERQKRTPDWMIERLALGELDAATADAVRAQLRAEGRDPEALVAALATSNQEILATYRAPEVAAEVRRRARATGARWQWWVGIPAVVVGVAAIVLTIAFPGPVPGPVGGDQGSAPLEPTGIKGGPAQPGPHLYVYRHGAAGDQTLANGARAARGDLLQLAYKVKGGGWVALLSLDGAGKVTVHWPEGGGKAVPLRDASEIRLPSAYELDDAPDFERFFLIRSDAPFDVAPIAAAVRSLSGRRGAQVAPLPLPLSYEQTSLLLAKPRKEMP
jgi:hypothetical protein